VRDRVKPRILGGGTDSGIVKLEIDPDEWADKLDSIVLQTGVGDTAPHYLALPEGSAERRLAEECSLTIGRNFRPGSGTVAISSVNGNQVWISPLMINPGDYVGGSALMAHEALHKFGLLDGEIQTRLGLSTAEASRNISEKLGTDCFSGTPGILP
jgi:hypothetical protein